jgi:hypothetical protein
MPFYEDQNRAQLRQMYIEAWQRHRDKLPLEPVQAQIASVIELHPEFHALLADPEAPNRDFPPELGQTNPFLHLGMHIAVREQIATDRPAGIKAAFEVLLRRAADAHDAEHHVAECLGECLWEAQRAGRPPDEQNYLSRVRRRARGKGWGKR